MTPNPALNPVRFALWTLRDKAAQRVGCFYVLSDRSLKPATAVLGTLQPGSPATTCHQAEFKCAKLGVNR